MSLPSRQSLVFASDPAPCAHIIDIPTLSADLDMSTKESDNSLSSSKMRRNSNDGAYKTAYLRLQPILYSLSNYLSASPPTSNSFSLIIYYCFVDYFFLHGGQSACVQYVIVLPLPSLTCYDDDENQSSVIRNGAVGTGFSKQKNSPLQHQEPEQFSPTRPSALQICEVNGGETAFKC